MQECVQLQNAGAMSMLQSRSHLTRINRGNRDFALCKNAEGEPAHKLRYYVRHFTYICIVTCQNSDREGNIHAIIAQ